LSAYTERLLDRAAAYLSRGDVIPLDLFSELMVAGIDVVQLEKNHANKTKGKFKDGTTV
jgi:hypothetical protein